MFRNASSTLPFLVLLLAEPALSTLVQFEATPSGAGYQYTFAVAHEGSFSEPIYELLLLVPVDPSIFDPNLSTRPSGWGDSSGGLFLTGEDFLLGGTYFYWQADASMVFDIPVGGTLSGFGIFSLLSLQEISIYYDLNSRGMFGVVEPYGPPTSPVPEPSTAVPLLVALAALGWWCRRRRARSPAEETIRPLCLGLAVLVPALVSPTLAVAGSYTLSGYVMEPNGSTPVFGAAVTLTAGSATRSALTSSTGKYQFDSVQAGTACTLNVSKTGFLFQGVPLTFSMPERNHVLFPITGTPGCNAGSCTITVLVQTSTGSAVPGASVVLSGSKSQTQQTDIRGTARFVVPQGGSFILLANQAGFTFTPSSHAVSNIGANLTRTFIAYGQPVTLSGRVTSMQGGTAVPVPNVTIVLAQGSTETPQVTSQAGAYSFANLQSGATYYVVPKSGQPFSFVPTGYRLTALTSQASLDFTATPTGSPAIDVVPSNLSLNTNMPYPGGTITVTFTLENKFSDPTKSFLARLTLISDPANPTLPVPEAILPPVDLTISALSGSEVRHLSHAIVLPVDLSKRQPPIAYLPLGAYFLRLEIDPLRELGETGSAALANNVITNTLHIQPRLGYGVTVLTHGHRFGHNDVRHLPPGWIFDMARAIQRRAGYGRVFLYDKPLGVFRPATDADARTAGASETGFDHASALCPATDIGPCGENILILNWNDEAGFLESGWSEPVADAFFAAIVRHFSNEGKTKFPLHRAHFIGFSRGAVVNSEIVERLLAAGTVSFEDLHVTNLDPHDWGLSSDPCPTVLSGWSDCAVNRDAGLNTGVVVWTGTHHADTYYQSGRWNPQDLGGRSVRASLSCQFDNDLDHSDIHFQYLSSVTAFDGTFVDVSLLTGCAYGERTPTPNQRPTFPGYSSSRVGGGDRPSVSHGETTPVDARAFQRRVTGGGFTTDFPPAWNLDESNGRWRLAGWSLHGGIDSYVADAAELGVDVALVLRTDYGLIDRSRSEVRHNWIYVPPSASHLEFSYERTFSSQPGGERLVVLEDRGGQPRTAWSASCGNGTLPDGIPLADPVRACKFAIPETSRGTVLRFWIEIQGAGSASRVEVRIGDIRFVSSISTSDIGGPLISVNNGLSQVAAATPLLLSGTVSDASGIASFWWVSDSGASGAVTHVGAQWSVPVPVVPGVNVVLLTAVDIVGNVGTVTVQVVWKKTITLSLQSNPPGRTVSVDGSFYQTPADLARAPGVPVRVSALDQVGGAYGTRYIFKSWSDGLGATHTFVPLLDSTLLVTFTTQHLVSATVVPVGSGTVTVTPAASDSYYTEGQLLQVSATPAAGFAFQDWVSGSFSSSQTLAVTVSAPLSLTARFSAVGAISVSVSPQQVSLSPGGAQQFSATVLNASSSGVVWSLNPPVGSISTSGLYTAPPLISQEQTVEIIATSLVDGSKTGSTSVRLVFVGGQITRIWTRGADMPTSRLADAAGIGVVRGKITVIGHHEGSPGTGRVNEEYDPATDSWATKSPHPRPEGRLHLNWNAVIGDKIYLFGGANVLNTYHTQTVDAYNPVTNAWEADVAIYPVPVAGVATAPFNGQVYCFGGQDFNGPPYLLAYRFDSVTRAFARLADMPRGRSRAHSFVKDGRIWVAGGYAGTTPQPHIDLYEPETNRWSTGPSLPRADQAASWVGLLEDGFVHALYINSALKPVVYKLDGAWQLLREASLPQRAFGVAVVGASLFAMGGGDPKVNFVQRFGPALPGNLSFAEFFDTPPDFSGRWTKVVDKGVTQLEYYLGELRLRAGNTNPSSGIDLRANPVFNGSRQEYTVQLNHRGYGRSALILSAVRNNETVGGVWLDTNDVATLGFWCNLTPTGYQENAWQYWSGPYLNRWTTLKIVLDGARVEFYADGVLKHTFTLAQPETSNYFSIHTGSASWKSGWNDTLWRSVLVTTQP